jgi:hypothetical protein
MNQIRVASIPLLVVGSAALLWFVSDRLLYVGPLDRATFGWGVVVPIWAAAPAAAGYAWRRLALGTRTAAAIIGGLSVGGVAAGLLWWSAATVSCRPSHAPVDLILPAIAVGAVVGGGFGLGCRVASDQLLAGHPWRAITFGALVQLAVMALTPTLAFVLFFGLCARP